MVVKLGQQCHVGEKPTVILYSKYTYINRHAGIPEKTGKTKQRQCSTPSLMVVIIYYQVLNITWATNTNLYNKPLHGSPMVVTLGQRYNVGEKPTVLLYTLY